MPRLILKCPYIKGGSENTSAHLGNLVNYIATRDGVERIRVEDKNFPSTIKQEELIAQIIKELPSTKNLFEYEDYISNSTIENASEFISVALEQNFDKIGKRKNYVDYIANRPRVEKMGKHGLFTGGDDALVLSRIVDEVANHTGNIWTPIVSLRREDAARLGFDQAESWHNMISYYAIDIAECLKIKPENFQWYAAFHNEGHHPHVHMICYSADPKEGYLTKKGIEKMKSGFVKNIFGQELEKIYIEQSKRRDELKHESREVLMQLISEMKNGTMQNSNIEEKLINLSDRLKFTNGKKQYGYLQPQLKEMVDDIVDELAKDERISKAYKLWYEMRNEVLHSYMDSLPESLPLSEQKEFKLIKNMIIKEADNLNKGVITFEELDDADEMIAEEIYTDDLFMHDTVVINEDLGNININLKSSFLYYGKAKVILKEENPDEDDIKRAVNFLEIASDNGNQFAQYMLGKLYLLGRYVSEDKEMAKEYFTLSAEQGNEYAKFFLENMDKIHNPTVCLVASRMLHHMSKIFEDSIPFKSSEVGHKIDSKLMKRLREKKVAQGHKRDDKEQEIIL
ncbi:MobP3 family relaxase [Tissierella sp.]|uniref:MobP3 family relaxase n=1 Tax=Tissierella sp. TaxID=41274 RepID=UPI00285642FC|nr:MobP3 family relaxase [Tissierella sp.]MDR7855899.1 MobP3 family relaxase [Tissierella sp.]